MRKLKVYAWRGWREACVAAPNGSKQTREIIAAPSWAAATRAYGRGLSARNGSETGNAREIAVATSKPGVVFWQPLNARTDEWTAVSAPRAPKETKDAH